MTSAEREQLEADLSAYLDGELTTDRVRQVEQLLAESLEARQLLGDLRRISRRLHRLSRRRAPDALAGALRAQAEHTLAHLAASRRRVRILRLSAEIGASAAIVLLCMFVAYRAVPTSRAPGSVEPAAVALGDRTVSPADTGRPSADRDGDSLRDLAVPQDKLAAITPQERVVPGHVLRQLESLGYVSAPEVAGEAQRLDDTELSDAAPLAAAAPAGSQPSMAFAAELEAVVDTPPDLVVAVSVQARDAKEYSRTADTLRAWSASEDRTGVFYTKAVGPKSAVGGPSPATSPPAKDEPETAAPSGEPLERVYRLPLADVDTRLSALVARGDLTDQLGVQVASQQGGNTTLLYAWQYHGRNVDPAALQAGGSAAAPATPAAESPLPGPPPREGSDVQSAKPAAKGKAAARPAARPATSERKSRGGTAAESAPTSRSAASTPVETLSPASQPVTQTLPDSAPYRADRFFQYVPLLKREYALINKVDPNTLTADNVGKALITLRVTLLPPPATSAPALPATSPATQP